MWVKCLAIAAVVLSALPAAVSATPSSTLLPAIGERKGEVIAVHGGAWLLTGPGAVATIMPAAERLQAAGWDVQVMDYAPGTGSLADVYAYYRSERARLGERETICAYGESAGGQLVLMLAATDPDLDCAIGAAAPTDLTGYPPVPGDAGPASYVPDALQAMFAGNQADEVAWSPVDQPAPATPVMLAAATEDPVVHYSDAIDLVQRWPTATLHSLDEGQAPFVHSPVDSGELVAVEADEAAFLARAAGLAAAGPGPRRPVDDRPEPPAHYAFPSKPTETAWAPQPQPPPLDVADPHAPAAPA